MSIFILISSLQTNFAADTSINPGNSTIKDGLVAVNNGETLTLDSGNYSGTNNKGLTINKSITIRGNGPINSVIIDAEKNSRIFSIGNNTNVTFMNITFMNGKLTMLAGAAIFNNYANSSLTFINCSFLNNNVTGSGGYGGAIYNLGNHLKITNCDFINNKGLNYGGAVYNGGNGSFNISNSSFSNNIADGFGGAIYNEGNAKISINNSNFTSNDGSSSGWGGAIYSNGGGDLYIIHSYFNNNTGWMGGAIHMRNDSDSVLFISNSTFINNSVTNEGGAIWNIEVISL